MFSALRDKQVIEYPLVVKADTQGTVEAIVGSINKIAPTDQGARSCTRASAASPRAT